MRSKTLIAALLCAAILFTLLAGCQSENDEAPDSAPPEAPASDGSAETEIVEGIDFEAAFATFAPDTVMITAKGYSVTWAEMFFMLHSNINSLTAAAGELPDLSTTLPNGITYAQALIDRAVEDALQSRAFEYGAMLSGMTLSGVELEMLEFSVEEMISMAGNEEALLALLWEHSGIKDLALFEYFVYVDYLPLMLFHHLFGEMGNKVTDEEAAQFTRDDGFLMAKHIIRSKHEDDSDVRLEELQDLLVRLSDYQGDDFEAYFDDLMFEYSEDQGGLAVFPDGYLFQRGDLDTPFYEAVAALEIGDFYGIVESHDGYHIVLRTPVNFDVIPVSEAFMGDSGTLRFLTAVAMFEAELNDWRNSLAPVFTPAFESIDLAAIFVWHEP